MSNFIPVTLPSLNLVSTVQVRGLTATAESWVSNDGAVLVRRVNPFTYKTEWVAYYEVVFERSKDVEAWIE